VSDGDVLPNRIALVVDSTIGIGGIRTTGRFSGITTGGTNAVNCTAPLYAAMVRVHVTPCSRTWCATGRASCVWALGIFCRDGMQAERAAHLRSGATGAGAAETLATDAVSLAVRRSRRPRSSRCCMMTP
jgi:hypothetical protein